MADWVGVWEFSGVAPDAATRLGHGLEQLGLEQVYAAGSPIVAAAAYAPAGFEDRVSCAQNQFGFAIAAGKPESPESNPAQHAFELYVRNRSSYAGLLNGAFAILIFDHIGSRLLLVRDPVGTIPIYYTTVGASVMFATRVAPLLEHCTCREPNRGALAELFIGGRWFSPGDTLYAGISALPAGHVLTLDGLGLRVDRYWDFPVEERVNDEEAYRFEFRRLLTQAVQRQLGSRKTAVFVSGGLDSSAVYALAHELLAPGDAPTGITWSTKDGAPSDESRHIEMLESRFGSSIKRVALSPTHDPHDDDDDIRYGELPFPNNLPGTAWRAHAAARAAGADVVLDGGWGDHVLAPFPPLYLATLFGRFQWLKASRHLREYLRYQPASQRGAMVRQCGRAMLRLNVPQWLIDQRRARLSAHRAAGPFTDAMVRQLSPVERWHEWLPAGASPHARSVLQTVYHPAHPLRYECTTKLTALYGVESLQPFLDRDLIAFLATLPGDVHTRAGVPKAILRDSLTELLPQSLLSRTEKGDYTKAIRDGITQSWSRYANRIVSSECAFDWHILERERVQERLARLESRRQIDLIAASWELLDLYGLVVWLESFYGAGKVSSSRRQYERINAEVRP